MKTFAVGNQKGGVGKTTTAHNLAAGFAARGSRCLLIDLDSQSNLSTIAGADQSGPGTYGLLTGTPAADLIQNVTDNLFIITGSALLVKRDFVPPQDTLFRALAPIRGDFDICIIDIPPALGPLCINGLAAADSLIIPTSANVLGLESIKQFYFGAISSVTTGESPVNPKLKISGILFNRVNSRRSLPKEAAKAAEPIAEMMHTEVFPVMIRDAADIETAQVYRQSIFDYAPRSGAAADYNKLIDILEKEG